MKKREVSKVISRQHYNNEILYQKLPGNLGFDWRLSLQPLPSQPILRQHFRKIQTQIHTFHNSLIFALSEFNKFEFNFRYPIIHPINNKKDILNCNNSRNNRRDFQT